MSTITVANASALVGKDISALCGTVVGPVLRAGDLGFADEHAGFNLAIERRPALVVGATDAFDVQAAVRFAVRHGLPVGVQCTGHQGYDIVEDCVLIKTGRMDTVHIDPVARIARVGAGARWGQVVEAAAGFGLAALNGSSSQVGVVGYTLGGGFSPVMGRKHGWAADHVRAVEMVTADGGLRRVTASADPHLFWAVRGGKSNFGVVTAIEFDLFPLSGIYGGGIYFDGADAPELLAAYRAWVETAPEELSSSIALLRLPPLPEVPEPLRGKLTVHLRVSYVGDAADGERLLAPMRAVAPALVDAVGALPYTACDLIHQDPVDPMPFGERGTMLTDLTAEGIAALLDIVGPGAPADTSLALVEIRHLDGALSRPPAVPNAVAGRDARFSVWGAAVGGPGQIAAGVSELDRLLDWLAPSASGSVYVNFVSQQQPVEFAYAAEDLARLRAVKTAYDPENVFRIYNHNILPA